jgi:hypothetical protein
MSTRGVPGSDSIIAFSKGRSRANLRMGGRIAPIHSILDRFSYRCQQAFLGRDLAS